MPQTFPASKPATIRVLLPFTLILAAAASFAIDQPPTDLRSLYDGHHWFQLRDAVSKTESRRIYQGAVAAAFNQRDEPEICVQRAIAATSASDESAAARELLIHLYMRAGQYSKAVARMKEQIASKSGKPPPSGDQAMLAVISQLPDQITASRGASTLRYEMRGASLSVTLNINGKPVNFLLDSDSNMSVISESEASRLGMSVLQGDISVAGVTGTAGGARIAVAKELVAGSIRFKNVAFLVLRDDQDPFVDWPAGTRGILGLPVMLALETLRWRPHGTIDIGFTPARRTCRAPTSASIVMIQSSNLNSTAENSNLYWILAARIVNSGRHSRKTSRLS